MRKIRLISIFFLGGGPQIYVTWFALTSFIIPLLALSFYYARICVRIRQNLRSKEMDKERSMKKPTVATTMTSSMRKCRDRDVVVLTPDASATNLSPWSKLRKWGYEKVKYKPEKFSAQICLFEPCICCLFHQRSTSSFYVHRSQTVKLSVFFALLESAHIKICL